jgi:hypothetical protein
MKTYNIDDAIESDRQRAVSLYLYRKQIGKTIKFEILLFVVNSCSQLAVSYVCSKVLGRNK